jgi:hypothetical protein
MPGHRGGAGRPLCTRRPAFGPRAGARSARDPWGQSQPCPARGAHHGARAPWWAAPTGLGVSRRHARHAGAAARKPPDVWGAATLVPQPTARTTAHVARAGRAAPKAQRQQWHNPLFGRVGLLTTGGLIRVRPGSAPAVAPAPPRGRPPQRCVLPQETPCKPGWLSP